MQTICRGSVTTLSLYYCLFSLAAGLMLGLPPERYLQGCLFLPPLIVSLWTAVRWGRLLFPRRLQGPLAAAASLFLIPSLPVLPWIEGWLCVAILIVFLTCLLAFKIWLRDGMKIPSLLLLAGAVGLGTLAHPCFFLVLPWILVPLWYANHRRRNALLWTIGITALTMVLSWILPPLSAGTAPHTPLFPGSWPGGAAILAGSLYGWLLLGPVLYSAWKTFFGSDFRQPSPVIRNLALLSTLLPLTGLLIPGTEVPVVLREATGFLFLPGMYLILVSGWVRLADRWRQNRSVPNFLAHQPVIAVYAISLLLWITLFAGQR